MSDHELSLDCDRDQPCEHWVHRTDPADRQRRNLAANRYQTAMFDLALKYEYDFEWKQEQRRPLILNEGTPYQEPFTVALALGWARRLAEVELA